MNDAFQFFQFPAVLKHDCSKRLPVDGPSRGQDAFPEGGDNLAPGRFSGPDDMTGQLIGVDHDSAAALEHLRDGGFARRNASSQAHENHAGKNSMDERSPLTSLPMD